MKQFLSLGLLVTNFALADGAPAQAGAQAGIAPFIPLLMIFAVFYFLILRPQTKKQKEQQKFLKEMKRGDMVVTSSGIIGTIRNVSDKFVTLEVDENVTLKILKGQILESATSLKDEKVAQTKEAPSH